MNALPPNLIAYAAIPVVAVLGLLAFQAARRVVALGFFLLYFAIGFAIVYAATVVASHRLETPWAVPLSGGLAFATLVGAIRSKLMRLVTVVMLATLIGVGVKIWNQYASPAEGNLTHDRLQPGLPVPR